MSAVRNPLTEVASWASDTSEKTRPNGLHQGSFDPEGFIRRNLKVHRGPVPYKGGAKWEVDCPFDPQHKAPDAAVFQDATGVLGFRCLHNSCNGKHWVDVRELFDGPRPKVHERNSDKLGSIVPPLISATDLYNSNIIPAKCVFDDLLWDGLTLLVAKPKAGKSWLVLGCAVATAGGRQVPGITSSGHGPVLYGALEEPRARTASRLRKIAPDGAWTENLHFLYELLPFMGGGAEQLAAAMERVRPRLVVLDTLTALLKTGTKSDSDVFRAQYGEVSRLRKLAEEFRTAIVVVHHVRKGVSDGAIEAVAGTGGIAAAVDSVWQLKRKPEGEATLEIVGREAEERTLALKFGQQPFGWQVLGDDDGQVLNAERKQILDLLREDGALTPAQVAAELAKSRPAVRMLLKRMKDDGLITKDGTRYIPTHTVSYKLQSVCVEE
jgi:DNA-binding transcriptional ArsR family regulator